MTRIEKAVERYKSGFNCAQAVFPSFSGLPEKEAYKRASAFGAGFGRSAESCGAVTGAIMAISEKYGHVESRDTKSKEKAYELTRKFTDTFREKYGSLICREILGHDISTQYGRIDAVESGVSETKCPEIVRPAAEILEEIM